MWEALNATNNTVCRLQVGCYFSVSVRRLIPRLRESVETASRFQPLDDNLSIKALP